MIRLPQTTHLKRCGATISVVALTLFSALYSASNRAATLNTNVPAAAQASFVYVGTQQRQIVGLRFDASTGKLTDLGELAQGPKSTWVTAHPSLPVLYSVDDDSTHEGSVTAYAVNRETGALTKADAVASGGAGTTNLSLDTSTESLFAANYNSGSVSSFRVNRDGSVGALASTVAETGSGPNRRQASAHAHNAVLDPSGHYVLVPDLGADRVFVYRFDPATHALSAANDTSEHAFVAPAGSGPRHLVFSRDGRFAYVITELSAQMLVLRWDAASAHLTLVQALPLSSAAFQGVKSGAEVAISPDGRFVYAEDRGENELVVYRVNAESGELSEIQRIASGGEKPWSFALHPSGKWLVVANQHSGTVSVFGVDPGTGMLSDTGQSMAVPTAVSIAFVG